MELAAFEAGLAERPELMTDIVNKYQDQLVTGLTGKGLHIATTEQYATDRAAAIGQGSKKAHEDWEGYFAEVTGKTKPEGKKGLDWAKEEKANLRYGTSGDDSATSQRITNLTNENTQLKQDLEREKNGVFQAKVDSAVDAGVGALKFRVPTDLTDDNLKRSYLSDQVDGARAMFVSKYTPEKMTDGRVLYKDKAGNAMIDAAGGPLSVEQIFAKNHAHLLQPSSFRQGGTGGGKDDEHQNKDNAAWLGATTAEISAKLSEMGLGAGTKDWREKYVAAHLAAGYVKKGDYYEKPEAK